MSLSLVLYAILECPCNYGSLVWQGSPRYTTTSLELFKCLLFSNLKCRFLACSLKEIYLFSEVAQSYNALAWICTYCGEQIGASGDKPSTPPRKKILHYINLLV